MKAKLGWRLLYASLALGGIALFVTLGTWQRHRAVEKEQLLRAYAAAATMEPVELARALNSGDDLPGANRALNPGDPGGANTGVLAKAPLRVHGRGRYDAAATVLLDNQMHDERVGVMVLTLFRVTGSDRPLLINRGWLPLPGDRQLPAVAAPSAEEVEVSGVLTTVTSTGVRLGNASYSRGAAMPLLAYLDVPSLRTQMGAELFDGMLLLDAERDAGFARQWQALPNTLPPERHRAYAVQWYALALAVAVTYTILAWRSGR